jgi:hypothetical protein
VKEVAFFNRIGVCAAVKTDRVTVTSHQPNFAGCYFSRLTIGDFDFHGFHWADRMVGALVLEHNRVDAFSEIRLKKLI